MKNEKLKCELTEKELLSIRACAYGANGNRKLVCGTFTVFSKDGSIKEKIPFDEAITTVYNLLDRLYENSK